jgi:hypothetical protein
VHTNFDWDFVDLETLLEMHRCLMIPEICVQICNEICELQSRKTLAAMAQSCRTFEQPALSILWHTQLSMGPMMGCLPDGVWEQSAESGATTLVNVVDALTLRRC